MCLLASELGPCIPYIDQSSIEFVGAGQFAVIYKARLIVDLNFFLSTVRIPLGLVATPLGPLGNVYKAKTYIAIKIIPRTILPSGFRLAMREPMLLQQNFKGNPFIVKLFGSLWDERKLYYIMEYVPGITLDCYMKYLKEKRKQVNFVEADHRSLIAEMVCAVGILHDELKVIHRDIKSENIKLTLNGHIKILDLGMGQTIYGLETERTFTACGSPVYAPPELIDRSVHSEYGKQIDWWSLGVCLYKLFTGSSPFEEFKGNSRMKIFKNILTMKLEQTFMYRLLQHRAPPPAVDLINRLLDKKPATRLGAGHTGTQDVKKHSFFQGVDWMKIRKRETPVVDPIKIAAAKQAEYEEEKILLKRELAMMSTAGEDTPRGHNSLQNLKST